MAQVWDWAPKDPDEIKRYWHDWTNYLGEGETISSVTCILDKGTVEVLQGNDITPGNLQPVKLSGGVDGEFCRLTLRATIDEGDQIYETGIHIRIQSK